MKDDGVVSREVRELALRNSASQKTCLKWERKSGHPGSPIPALSLPQEREQAVREWRTKSSGFGLDLLLYFSLLEAWLFLALEEVP